MTPNVARTISCKAWKSPAEYPSWVAKCYIKGSDGNILNPIFWKKVQGQKHPGRWGIAEHQIPSIKVQFKTYTKSHRLPGIKVLSESKTQLVNQRKQNSYRRANIYVNTELLDGNKGHQEETHYPTHRFRPLFLDLLSMGWRGCASAMGAIKLPPSCSSPKSCQSIHIVYSIDDRLGKLKIPTLMYRRLRGDMKNVYKYQNEIYDTETSILPCSRKLNSFCLIWSPQRELRLSLA